MERHISKKNILFNIFTTGPPFAIRPGKCDCSSLLTSASVAFSFFPSMGNRRKAPRSSNPLLVASAALTRAVDPSNPSRITVIRLLGDALDTLQESQLVVDAVRARSAAQVSRSDSAARSFNRIQTETDSRLRTAHEQGARALFSAVVAVLLKLPTRAGPLWRRAVEIISIAGRAAGPAVAMQASDRVRAHISGLKKFSWTNSDVGLFEVVCAVFTLAEISSCNIAGREVARESIQFLLSQRVRQKCKRPYVSHAVAIIIQSFPQHAPPDDRIVDIIMDVCLPSTSPKQSSLGFGAALLTAVVAPLLVSRGPAASDKIVAECFKALKVAATSTERGMWAVALVRASVTARRSSTFQLRKYGTTESGCKFPQNLVTGAPVKLGKCLDDVNPSVWVSDDIFQQSLVQVAQLMGFSDGNIDASVAVASVLRMWAEALPDSIPNIIPCVFAKLRADLKSVTAFSALVDAIWLGLLKHLKPSLSPFVFEKLLPLLNYSGLPLASILHIYSTLLSKHGRQCIRETGLTVDYNSTTNLLIQRILDALELPSAAARCSGVRLLYSLICALPRLCSRFITAILQNLRIADLTLATKKLVHADSHTNSNTFNNFDEGLSSILGNAAALSVMVEMTTVGRCSVPAALKEQCVIDSFALLRPHHASSAQNDLDPLRACVRRRAGWGLIAALARGKQKAVFEGDSLRNLISLWTEESVHAGNRSGRNDIATSLFGPGPTSSLPQDVDQLSGPKLEEYLATCSTRSAALYALLCALQHARSPQLEQCARTVVAACTTRIVALLVGINSSTSLGNVGSGGNIISFSLGQAATNDSIAGKKYNTTQLIRFLAGESSLLVQCIAIVPVSGDAGDLCFIVSLALSEEAEKVLGETQPGHTANALFMQGASTNRGVRLDSALTNQRSSLSQVSCHGASLSSDHCFKRRKPESGKSALKWPKATIQRVEDAWLFGRQGINTPHAEHCLIYAGRGLAAVITQNLSVSGSLIEYLSGTKLSPTMSAILALELTKRLSRSDLAEINRTLAMLQVLTRRSLEITNGSERSISSQNKLGKLYPTSRQGDGRCFNHRDLPGAALQEVTDSEGNLSWARTFCDEGHIGKLPFHNFHTRALGMMYATRTIAAEAHHELSITGGPALWTGLMRKVMTIVKNNMEGSTPTQFIILSNAIATLGGLLEVVPETHQELREDSQNESSANHSRNDSALDDISDEAIDIIANAIEKGTAGVQAMAALSLSTRSHRVAAASERILAALLRAWSQDKGDFMALGHFGNCANEADIWTSCFIHIWRDMGVRDFENQTRFFLRSIHGINSSSPSLAIGATAVLSSCRLHWLPLSESCFSSVREICIELLQWNGTNSEKARAAGLYGMTALWAARIDATQIQYISGTNGFSDKLFSDISPTNDLARDVAVLPIESFSVKDQSRASSPVGPFLDEVLYNALAPLENSGCNYDLQEAATAAVAEIIRGAGVEKTCANLPRLPESLFSSVDCGVSEAKKVLETLVRRDALKRPRYWFGLCRAICLNADRLNYGSQKCVWDVSTESKAYTVNVAVRAVDFSMASCKCSKGKSTSISLAMHTCAYGFFKKVIDFAIQICNPDTSDFEVCLKGCKLLRRVSSRVGRAKMRSNESSQILFELMEIWESCVPTLSCLFMDRVPHSVVTSAASALSEQLVLKIELNNNKTSDCDGSAGSSISFLEALLAGNLRNRFRYADQGEDVGLHTMLAIVSKYARVLSSRQVSFSSIENPSKENVIRETTIRSILFALCGDFVSSLKEGGSKVLAKNGGAITPGLVEESQLQDIFSIYIAPIVLGVVSCSLHVDINSNSDSFPQWGNKDSFGARIALCSTEGKNNALATLVWFMKHEHDEKICKTDWHSFSVQCSEVIESLLGQGEVLCSLSVEVLVSFAEWRKSEFLTIAKRISTRSDIHSSSSILVLNIILSVLLAAAEDEFSTFQEMESQSVENALQSLLNIAYGLKKGCPSELSGETVKVLDVILQMVYSESPAVLSVFTAPKVQAMVCKLMTFCVRVNPESSVAEACRVKVCALFKYGREEASASHIKISLSLLAALCNVPSHACNDVLVEFLTLGGLVNGHSFVQNTPLMLSLDCNGIEDFIVSCINDTCDIDEYSECGNVVALLHKFGELAVSDESFCVPVALRCATAASLVNGKHSDVINKMGLVLHSLLLSKLVQSLPVGREDLEDELKESSSGSGAYFAKLFGDEKPSLGMFVSALSEEERKKGKRFFEIWDEHFQSNR